MKIELCEILKAANDYAGVDDKKWRGFVTTILCGTGEITSEDIKWAEKVLDQLTINKNGE